MKKQFYVLIVLVLTVVSMAMATTDYKLLISVFSNFKKIAATGHETEIDRYMSTRYLNTMKNNCSSLGIKLGEEQIKDLAGQYEISKGKFIKLIENGPTSLIVMNLPTTDMDGNDPQTQFLFLKFVKEDSVWKYDGGATNTEHKYDEKGNLTQFTEALIPKRLVLNGNLPEVPVLIPIAEVRANFFIMTQGYSVSMAVNGGSPLKVTEGSDSGLLPGGLKKGENVVALTITKETDKSLLYPNVKIYYADKNNNEVIAFKLDKTGEKTGTFKQTFSVAVK
jgi:hypothetical protein